jgi:UDP-GlcNAc:undecaprenyl-phosphate GlcNAc-1-phosphate transferase
MKPTFAMSLLAVVGPALLSGLLSFVLTPLARLTSVWLGVIDQPDPRKIHREPMPRLGGLAVLVAVGTVLTAGWFGLLGPFGRLPGAFARGMALGAIPVIAISLYDDVRGVRARWKALAHLVGALIAVQLGVVLNPDIHILGEQFHIGVLAVPLSVLWIVGLTNAFNLVDGLDGLSAGLALISSVSLAAVYLIVGERGTASCVLVLAGALLGFLPFNAYPAKIFLGDMGAASVGFLLACFAVKGGATMSAGFAAVLPVLVLGLPIAETVISMARRLLRRAERGGIGVFEADRDHIHHRLLGIGLNHRRAVLFLYGIGVSLAILGLISLFVTARQAALLLVAILIAAFIGIKRLGYDEFAFVRKGLALRVYDAPVVRTALFAVFFDMFLVATSFYLARGLKFEVWALRVPGPATTTLLGLLLLLSVGTFWAFGLYRGTWRFASLDAINRCGAAVAVSTLLTWGLAPGFVGDRGSASQFAIYGLVATGMICGSRMSYRLLQHRAWKASIEGEPILIYGAGAGGTAALRELRGNPAWRMRSVGFVDDDPALRGKLVSGLPVVGTVEEIETLLARCEARGVAIASEKIPCEKVQAVRTVCEARSIPVYRFDVRFDPEDSDHRDDGKRGVSR